MVWVAMETSTGQVELELAPHTIESCVKPWATYGSTHYLWGCWWEGCECEVNLG